MQPIISVMVPTKNRYKYLIHLITLIEGFNDKRIELVIHDNSDNNSEIINFMNGKSFVSIFMILTNFLWEKMQKEELTNVQENIFVL